MFKKPAQLKPSTPLRSSSRRAFQAHLQSLYPALAEAEQDVLSEVVPTGLRHCGATTSSGQKAVIYSDEHGKPLWFELGSQAGAALQQAEKQKKASGSSNSNNNGKTHKLEEVIPTVYALWLFPPILPRLPTWPQIVDPTLLGGSALMVPGLIPPPHTFPLELQYGSSQEEEPMKPSKSSLVAITPYPSPVPMVVARLDMSVEDMIQRRAKGEKGKAATTIHSLGDQLWELGGKENPPESVREPAVKSELSRDTGEKIDEKMRQLNVSDRESDEEEGGKGSKGEEKEGGPETSSFSTAEVDSILHLALLTSVVKLAKQQSHLPIQVSSFYSSHVLPNRPAHWPPRDAKGKRRARLPDFLVEMDPARGSDDEREITGEAADVRRSSAKKLGKWIKAAEKKELLKNKDVKGKDSVIAAVNGSHKELTALGPFFTYGQAQQDNAASQGSTPDDSSAKDRRQAQDPTLAATQVVIERFWKANASSVKLFQEMGASTSEPLSRPQIKQFLNDFTTSRSLIDSRNQAQVRVEDPILTSALYPKATLKDIPPTLKREEMLERLLCTSCVEYHRTSRLSRENAQKVSLANQKGNVKGGGMGEIEISEGEQVGSIAKGAAKPVRIEVKTRQGRKVITLIIGLEVYGMDAEQFAGDLMRFVGASASASPLANSTPKNPKYEVFVQGDQRKASLDFLAKNGLGKQFVEAVDMTKK